MRIWKKLWTVTFTSLLIFNRFQMSRNKLRKNTKVAYNKQTGKAPCWRSVARHCSLLFDFVVADIGIVSAVWWIHANLKSRQTLLKPIIWHRYFTSVKSLTGICGLKVSQSAPNLFIAPSSFDGGSRSGRGGSNFFGEKIQIWKWEKISRWAVAWGEDLWTK